MKYFLSLRKSLAIQKWKAHDLDTGSAPVQIDILTQRIRSLEKHLSKNKKDTINKRALTMLVRRRSAFHLVSLSLSAHLSDFSSCRRGLMTYLKKRDVETYYAVLSNIGLRDLYELYPHQSLSKLPTKFRK